MINGTGSTWWRRWAPAVGLMLLSPFCAEYLIGYQGVITSPFGMLVAVLMVLPIYGAPAVIIREVTRRAGRGWPTMLLLATAAGLIQAGLIDQSLFNHADFGAAATPTLIPVIDVDAGQLLTFIVGHIIWSFGAPIAVVESCVPQRSSRAWLGIASLAVIAAVYVAGAIFYYVELVGNAGFEAHPGQLIGVAGAVALTVLAAAIVPRGSRKDLGSAPARPWLAPVPIALAVLILTLGFVLLDGQWGWVGICLRIVVLVLLALILAKASQSENWVRPHVFAAAAAALLVYTGLAFLVNPEQTPRSTLIIARGVVAVLMVLLLALIARRLRNATFDSSSRTLSAQGSRGRHG